MAGSQVRCLEMGLLGPPSLSTQTALIVFSMGIPPPPLPIPPAQTCLHGSKKRREERSWMIRLVTIIITIPTFSILYTTNIIPNISNILYFFLQECVLVRDLCNKWNSFCSSVHKKPHSSEKPLNFSSSSPSSTSISSYDQLSWPFIIEPKPLLKEHQFWVSENGDESERSFRIPDLLSNPNSSPNSASSSEASEDGEGVYGFKQVNEENLSILCNALERKAPWQKDIIPEIAKTVLECRSRTMIRRKNKLKQREDKEETWLLFLGVDCQGKEKVGRELAKLVFGSQSKFFAINPSNLGSTRADSTEDFLNKHAIREETNGSHLDKFAEAVHENPHRVFFIEDVEQLDYSSQMGIKRAIENGRIEVSGGEAVPLSDAIVIFSCESFSAVSRASSPPPPRRLKEQYSVSLDLNISAEDDHGYGESSVSETGVLDYVDRQFVFKIQEL